MTPRLSLFFAAAVLAGCPAPTEPDDRADPVVDPEPVDIVGAWVDGWDIEHAISEDAWTQGDSTFWFSEWSAEASWAVAENDQANPYNPGLWSRFDWTTVDGALYFCQTAYAAETEAEALATEAADPSDPTASGCAGFAWSRLYVPLSIRGTWEDTWGSVHDVREWTWTTDDLVFHLTRYDAVGGWAVAQNDADNAWNPGLWSRFEWVEVGDRVYYCQVAYDAPDEEAATTAAPADPTDPATGGCGGFAWTELTPTP